MRAAILRRVMLVALLGACLGSAGCVGTLAEALLAPESLALQGAYGGVQQLGNAVAGSVPSDATFVAADLDKILAEDDAAKQRPELQALSDKLKAQAAADSYKRRPGSIANEAERRAEIDRRVELPSSKRELFSDQLTLGQLDRKARRPVASQPMPQPEATPLDAWVPQVHVMDFSAVRLH